MHTPKTTTVKIGSVSLRTDITSDHHVFFADEPFAEGGTDIGPSPYQYLLAALGSCTAMTLRLYADHKRWPLRECIVHLMHNKVHIKDCKDCENNETYLDQIDRSIELIGELSAEQKNRLIEIANKCPVHRTLQSRIIINTKLLNQ